MPNQVDGAIVRAPCPVPSCPACELNSGSVLPSLSSKATRVEGADIVMQSIEFALPICGTGDPAISSLGIECIPDSISKNCKIPGYPQY